MHYKMKHDRRLGVNLTESFKPKIIRNNFLVILLIKKEQKENEEKIFFLTNLIRW